MLKNLKKRAEGFTIVEVMIVLAIAGLIMLIVFLAIPALQRNSRNTQRKSDVSAVLAAVGEWSNNNGGKLPGTAAEQAAAIGNANLGIYSQQVSWTTAWPTTTSVAYVVNNYKCNGQTDILAQNRAVVVLFLVETGGNNTARQCVDS